MPLSVQKKPPATGAGDCAFNPRISPELYNEILSIAQSDDRASKAPIFMATIAREALEIYVALRRSEILSAVWRHAQLEQRAILPLLEELLADQIEDLSSGARQQELFK